jgi:hypothetical protein
MAHQQKMIRDPNDEKVTDPEPEPKGSQTNPSPQEQMERYEEDLKENDWGHQPC